MGFQSAFNSVLGQAQGLAMIGTKLGKEEQQKAKAKKPDKFTQREKRITTALKSYEKRIQAINSAHQTMKERRDMIYGPMLYSEGE